VLYPRYSKDTNFFRAGMQQRGRQLGSGSSGRDHIVNNQWVSAAYPAFDAKSALHVSIALGSCQASL